MASRHNTIKVIESEDSLSIVKTSRAESVLEPPTTSPIHVPTDKCVILKKQKGRYNLEKPYRLENSLLAGVGFLELANAGDFPANVWNEIPVPRFAAALMAVGGTLALAISVFAFKDALLSRRNILRLREERRYLKKQNVDPVQRPEIARDLGSQLNVNFREMGTELVDRIGMDIVMGFGAVLVGTGTFMAIGGANPIIFQASNLLSGYIGNAPVALFGIVNAAWSAYVWRRAHRHSIVGKKELEAGIVKLALKGRTRKVKTHAAVNGVTGIIAGAASLITATMWYGYPILALCILSSILCNYFWRKRIGYDRPLVRRITGADKITLIEELKSVISTRQILDLTPSRSLPQLVSDPESMASVIEFLTKNDLFEDFCTRLLNDTSLSTLLFGTLDEELTIYPETLSGANKLYIPRCIEIAEKLVKETGSIRFRYRERYLLETLGCYLCSAGAETTSEKRGDCA
jgi:hypothetical protein